MKTTLAACLLLAATPIRAYTCGNGATALTYVKVVGVNAATITCKGIPGQFAAGQSPEDPYDPAQAYFGQVQAQGKCSASSPCTALCAVELAEDPLEALNTLLCQQEASCKAAGGTYSSRVL
jgi:hypothetical protein